MFTTLDIALVAIMAATYTIGTTMGFGTTVLSITFAAQLLPIGEILPVVTPLNLVLGVYIAASGREHIQWRIIFRRVYPMVLLGFPIGLLLFRFREAAGLRVVFGILVVLLALQRLVAMRRPAELKPLTGPLSWFALFCASVIHGVFATGGPLFVYVLGRELPDKVEFRSTVAAMFLPLSVLLITNFAIDGLFDAKAFQRIGLAVVPVALGIFGGEVVFKKLNPRGFQKALWGTLLVGGLLLMARYFIGL